ncbi:alpha-(1,3)-fucosyltransferase 7-like [Engraulis encrasicolus]|uniref:alpha-(1,3)-fucosyltransferase 7-like n=1 Tax=Engraulis encrasicolus TaxID=184585 RepID=UPI002FD5EFA6
MLKVRMRMRPSSRARSHHQGHCTVFPTGYRCKFASLLILCTILTYYLYPEWSWGSPVHHKGENETVVLVWHWPFHIPVEPNPGVCSHFGIHNCLLVDDRSWFSYADFVVFHNRELVIGEERLPRRRRPRNQRWVWLTLESPDNNGNLWPFAGYFNAIMSYSRNADFYLPYGRLVPRDKATALAVDDFVPKNKSSLACWVVSNYREEHRRTSVYRQLAAVLPVEVYGSASGRLLSSDDLLPTMSRCYFYLSFENSMHKDYITEKFWKNALLGQAVPVVLGPRREEYEAVVPKDSFIHVDDFDSVEKLGEFLIELSKDEQRYASYYAWHLNYTVDIFDDWQEEFCKICPQASSLPQKVYANLDLWEIS